MRANTHHVLLICSVGGTPEPVAAAIRHWCPARILLLCSEQTRHTIKGVLDSIANAGGSMISPGCTDQTILRDPQDLQQTLRDLRSLDQHVRSWCERGDDYVVVVDFTGGTKVMSAALALVARRWKCIFNYVGGQERNKDGVGVVVFGREMQFNQFNPWDALGYQAVEDAVAVFNHGGYAAAAALLDGAVKNAEKQEVKRELSTLKAVIDAYAAWDRFDHKQAEQRFGEALKNRNDLIAIFPHGAQSLTARLERHRERVKQLANQGEPTLSLVEDLLGNAERRAAEHRFDDAVARLYRAFEALAQDRLRQQYGIPRTKAVPLDQLPHRLRAEWSNRARDGLLFLGLQDAYRLLLEHGDDLGKSFAEAGFDDDQRSPLVARNQSILAHGFQLVSKEEYTKLRDGLSRLAHFDHGGRDDWRLPTPR